MKIAWFCIPAHGHTNPTLGLVKALTEAGHQVWYFSFENSERRSKMPEQRSSAVTVMILKWKIRVMRTA